MPIKFNKQLNVFHLYNKNISYMIHISKDKGVSHLYFGNYLKDFDLETLFVHTSYWNTYLKDGKEEFKDTSCFNFESSLMEYPGYGMGDYRTSAIKIKNINGDSTTHFVYKSHKIIKGKYNLQGLPSLYGSENDFTSLIITCKEVSSNVTLLLQYSISSTYPIICRSSKIINNSNDNVVIEKAYSSCLDFKTSDYDVLYLSGRYGKERNITRNKVMPGIQSIASLQGKSSHTCSPFVAIIDKDTTEDYGNVYAMNFAYSGNFDISINSNEDKLLRVLVGINPETFEYVLENKQELQTPEVILLHTNKGLGEMSRIYHKVLNNHMVRGKWKHSKRPLLLNSWQGCYMNFDTEKLLSIIDEAHKLNIEMFVLDDGWFGKRDNDTSSLGDWFVNDKKVDLHKVIDRLHSYNMKFGLWFEPEMVCPNSELYKAHPEYAIKSKNRVSTLMRHQMVLDMSKKEVVDNVYNQLEKMLKEYQIDYIKWDFNRSITEAYSDSLDYLHQKEFFHRFMLGTYSLLERLYQNYPDILIETCCAGGGRYDAGMLYYSPQIWTSDETDPIERLTIQEGTSMCFPVSSMGAHVSVSDRANFKTKAYIALQGSFGYELDPTKLTENEKSLVISQCEDYHKYYDLTHYGDLYRIISPNANPYKAAWMYVSEDKKEALLTYVASACSPESFTFIKLKGLDENKYYYCKQTNKTYYGKFLLECGINLTFENVYAGDGRIYHFIETKKG